MLGFKMVAEIIDGITGTHAGDIVRQADHAVGKTIKYGANFLKEHMPSWGTHPVSPSSTPGNGARIGGPDL